MASADRFCRKDPDPVPLDAMKSPEFDVREYREDADIDHIARSMNSEGQYMPVYLGQQDGDQYPIIDGNHRYLAAKRLGWPDLDAIKLDVDRDADMAQVITNLTRLELSNRDRIHVFHYLFDQLDLSVAEAADKVGIDRSQANKYANILDGFGEIRQFYVQGALGVEACYQLNLLDDRDAAVEIAERAIAEDYSDSTVVHQAKWRRGQEDKEDKMRLGKSGTVKQNMDQVRRNAEAIGELDPIDQQGVRDAQVAPDAAGDVHHGGDTAEGETPPDAPPCAGCGKPMDQGTIARVDLNPALAEQLGVQELRYGLDCTKKFIEWWAGLQNDEAVEGEEVTATDG